MGRAASTAAAPSSVLVCSSALATARCSPPFSRGNPHGSPRTVSDGLSQRESERIGSHARRTRSCPTRLSCSAATNCSRCGLRANCHRRDARTSCKWPRPGRGGGHSHDPASTQRAGRRCRSLHCSGLVQQASPLTRRRHWRGCEWRAHACNICTSVADSCWKRFSASI